MGRLEGIEGIEGISEHRLSDSISLGGSYLSQESIFGVDGFVASSTLI
jgi:hypothetical protein